MANIMSSKINFSESYLVFYLSCHEAMFDIISKGETKRDIETEITEATRCYFSHCLDTKYTRHLLQNAPFNSPMPWGELDIFFTCATSDLLGTLVSNSKVPTNQPIAKLIGMPLPPQLEEIVEQGKDLMLDSLPVSSILDLTTLLKIPRPEKLLQEAKH